MTFETLAKAVAARPSIDIDGSPFTLSLTSIGKPLPHRTQVVDVIFTAFSATTRHNGHLRLGVDEYTEDEIATLAVATIRKIARGEIVPGTVSPL